MSSANAAPSSHAPNFAPNAALLIDFDNVTMGIRSDLQGELNNLLSSDIVKGKVAVRRAYADWRRYPQYIVPLTESSIDLIFAPAYGSSKKNATDIRLAIDAMELVFTRPEIGTFVLLSGDSDFSSMVIKLKEYGKYVIGVGIRESSSDLLVMNCDEYYSYNALAGLTKTGDDESTRWDPWELVTESVARMKRNNDVMRSDRLKQVMQEIDASFDEKNLGHPKFSRFVQEAQQRGLVRVNKLDSGQLEIDTPDGTVPATAAAPASGTSADGEARRDASEREREERRGRRGRRGRGRDRFDRERDERPDDVSGEGAGSEAAGVFNADIDDNDSAAPDEVIDAGAPRLVDSFAPVAEVETVHADADAAAPAAPAATTADVEDAHEGREGRDRRGRRGRGRERGERGDRPERTERVEPPVSATRPGTPETAQASEEFGSAVADSIGSGGERLTRSEAFDLVRRAVESLVQGDDATSASAARQRAFELLRRDSESLTARNFERILQDAHDANMIDLRRRGHDWEVARAAEAASIVEQLKLVDDTQKADAKAAAALLPQAPRGMGARGVGPRGAGGRGGRGAANGPPADLLMFGVVGARPAAPIVNGSGPNVPAAVTPAPVAPAPSATVAAPVAAPAVAAPARKGANGGAKTAAKAPAKATKAPAKAVRPAAREAAPVPAKKSAKAPVKAAARTAAKTAAKTSAKTAAKPPAKKAARKR